MNPNQIVPSVWKLRVRGLCRGLVWVLALLIGTGCGVALFTTMQYLGAPIFLVYGVVRGLGQTLPFNIIPQFLGALIGRFYFQKRLGKTWRQYIPVVAAGFFCGQGLVTVFGVGITFISKAVVQLPF